LKWFKALKETINEVAAGNLIDIATLDAQALALEAPLIPPDMCPIKMMTFFEQFLNTQPAIRLQKLQQIIPENLGRLNAGIFDAKQYLFFILLFIIILIVSSQFKHQIKQQFWNNMFIR
jgi:hypothetical protein